MCSRALTLLLAAAVLGCETARPLPPRLPVSEGPPHVIPMTFAMDAPPGIQIDHHAASAPIPGVAAHFINVGQGDATLLEFACGVVLIDAGGDNDRDVRRLVEYLDAVFDRRPDLNRTIDLLLITHAHIDHTRALDALRKSFTIRRYIDGGRDTGSGIPPIRRLKAAAEDERIAVRGITDRDIAVLPHRRGLSDDFIDPLRCEHCDPRLTILAASHRHGSGPFSNENYHSLVFRVDFGEASFLFTGDLETRGIERLLDRYRGTDMLDVDVYHVGHHGHHDGTTPGLVQAMTPQLAVISCGGCTPTLDPISAYAYGNPRKKIIDMLSAHLERDRAHPHIEKIGAAPRWFNHHRIQRAIYCTAWDGDITVLADSEGSLRVLHQNERQNTKDTKRIEE